MSRLVWDQIGEKIYEAGVSNGVLYPFNAISKKYDKAVAWNGLSKVSESPSGAEPTAVYADNKKYLTLYSAEEYSATVEAYMYPDEFAECDGSAELAPGVTIGQQTRKSFGLSYQTLIGNDTEKENHGYKIHIVYGCMASPSSVDHDSINDSPDINPLSWEISTTPIDVEGHKPTATLVLDSTKVSEAAMTAVKDALYGTDAKEGYLPLPEEIMTIISEANAAG